MRQFITGKVQELTQQVKKLSEFAKSQPHAAYAAFTHGISAKWNYLLRVVDWEAISGSELLQPIETTIISDFIPALTGQLPPGELVRKLLALPVQLGGLGLTNPVVISIGQHTTSKLVSDPIVQLVIQQDDQLTACHTIQQQIKDRTHSNKQSNQKEDAKYLKTPLSVPLQRCMQLCQEKGASTWLTALPIDSLGFALHKSAFRDALALRYAWPIQNSPSHCACSRPFSIDHVLSCPTGGYPSIRHNELRDITASLLSEVCHGVSTEPHLQPITGETMLHRSAITDRGARLDIAVNGFWGGRFEKAFLDLRIFNPCAQSNRHTTLTSVYRRHELEKKREYEQRVREVEHATFTPLVMSTTGGMGRAATTFYIRLASMLSEKRDLPYCKTIGWIRCRLGFALLRSSIMSIRDARSTISRPAKEDPINLQITESRLE